MEIENVIFFAGLGFAGWLFYKHVTSFPPPPPKPRFWYAIPPADDSAWEMQAKLHPGGITATEARRMRRDEDPV